MLLCLAWEIHPTQSQPLGESKSGALSPQIIVLNEQPLSEVCFMWEKENKALKYDDSKYYINVNESV